MSFVDPTTGVPSTGSSDATPCAASEPAGREGRKLELIVRALELRRRPRGVCGRL